MYAILPAVEIRPYSALTVPFSAINPEEVKEIIKNNIEQQKIPVQLKLNLTS